MKRLLTHRPRAVLAVLFLVCTLPGSVARAADEMTEAAAEELYRSAFHPGVPARQQQEILMQVASEFKESAWADDAWWVLAERAAQARRPRLALKYRLKLVDKHPTVRLEAFTKRLDVYERSRVPKVLHVIEMEGQHIIRFDKRLLRYNPVPMVLHEDLAIQLVRMRQHKAARKHIELALKRSPGDGVYADILNHRLEELKEQEAHDKAVQKYKEKAERAETEENTDAEGRPASKQEADQEGEKQPEKTDDEDEEEESASEN